MDVPRISPLAASTFMNSATSQAERLARLYQLLEEEPNRPDEREARKRRVQAIIRRIEEITEKPATPNVHYDGQTHFLDTLA
jgi:hypothetical protein